MTGLHAQLIAECERQIRVNTAPRCGGSPARPRVIRDLRLPRLLPRRPQPAPCC